MVLEKGDDFFESLGSTAKPLYLVDRSPEEKAANAALIREKTMKMTFRRLVQGCLVGFILATGMAIFGYFKWLV